MREVIQVTNDRPKISHSEKSVDSGYEGVESPDREHSDFKRWNLRRISSGLHPGIVTQVECDGQARGIITLFSEEEFNWLKPRIDGDQPREASSPERG
jgi:hypothetical protein